jgi:hypothetical protein
MDRNSQPSHTLLAVAAVGLIWGNLALAGPPGRPAQNSLQNIGQRTGVTQRMETQRVEGQHIESAPHLDLRPPAMGGGEERSSTSFPSGRRQIEGSDTMRLPALGNTTLTQNTMQDLARRVRHEGLPVARIFEGKSSLVHVGFNQKGKPGLWLVQKTH